MVLLAPQLIGCDGAQQVHQVAIDSGAAHVSHHILQIDLPVMYLDYHLLQAAMHSRKGKANMYFEQHLMQEHDIKGDVRTGMGRAICLGC